MTESLRLRLVRSIRMGASAARALGRFAWLWIDFALGLVLPTDTSQVQSWLQTAGYAAGTLGNAFQKFDEWGSFRSSSTEFLDLYSKGMDAKARLMATDPPIGFARIHRQLLQATKAHVMLLEAILDNDGQQAKMLMRHLRRLYPSIPEQLLEIRAQVC